MSLINDVTDMVEELRQASADDLAPHLPHMTRDQILAGLQQAKFRGRLVLVEAAHGLGTGKGTTPAVYGPAPRAKVVPASRVRIPEARGASSVWEWGSRSAA